MKSLILISAVCLQLGWSYANGYSNGVGAFSYQDSSGRRYGGTYGLKDGEVVDTKGTFPPDFSPPTGFSPPNFEDPDDFTGFIPEYLRNLENLLQDTGFTYNTPTPQIPQYIQTPTTYSLFPIPTFGPGYNSIPNFDGPGYPNIPNYNHHINNFNRAFQANIDSQKLALDAAHKAFALTSKQAGFIPNLNPSRLTPFNDYSAYGDGGFPDMPNAPQFPNEFPFGGNPMPGFENGASSSAFAGAAVGPGYHHHVASINPANPNSPNINHMHTGSANPGGYKSISVSSYATSSDINGRKSSSQGAKTTVNDNGKITSYKVQNP